VLDESDFKANEVNGERVAQKYGRTGSSVGFLIRMCAIIEGI